MPGEPETELEAKLARIVHEVDHLKDALRLLGVRQCSHCAKWFRYPDAKTLFDSTKLVCYGCVQDWWHERSPSLTVKERLVLEDKLLRWLVAHHNARVIHQAGKMPRADEIELKIVVACEQCKGTGKSEAGGQCHHCDGRGTVWVVELRPDLQ